jgi:uncharacterized protein YndB with AHSA1/START domain
LVTYLSGVDDVFKALADSSRRKLLDRLFKRDGLTLGELCQRVDMTRFGVMKHLRVLEAAGVITTRRIGREKLHYLNAVPIRLIHDRWVSKYTAPIAAAMSALKSQLEETMSQEKLLQVYEVYIRTTQEKLWKAITDPAFTRQYLFHTSVESAYRPGEAIAYKFPDGKTAVDGVIIEADPPRRLVHTWVIQYDEKLRQERSRVTWQIEQRGDACKLTATHELDEAPLTAKHVGEGGWSLVLSGLKTLLETGEPLVVAPRA